MNDHRVRIYEQGPASVLRYEPLMPPLAPPARDQVLLRQEAIGVNFVDTMFRDGSFHVGLPFDMGVEAAGVIEAVGVGVSDFKPGDRAAYFFVPGAYASARLVDAAALIKLPEEVSTLRAAAFLAKGLTAWMAVRGAHMLLPGEIVYVNGAGGGVGLLVARWAASLGAIVVVAVGSPEKAAIARGQGLERVVVTSSATLNHDVKALTSGREIDVVYEFVGRATFEQSVRLLRPGGSMIHIGNASGGVEVDHAALAARRIHYLSPSTLQYVDTTAGLAVASQALFEALRQKVFGDLEIACYPLADAVRSHEDIALRRNPGFSVLVP